jgi:hypothetical protein
VVRADLHILAAEMAVPEIPKGRRYPRAGDTQGPEIPKGLPSGLHAGDNPFPFGRVNKHWPGRNGREDTRRPHVVADDGGTGNDRD